MMFYMGLGHVSLMQPSRHWWQVCTRVRGGILSVAQPAVSGCCAVMIADQQYEGARMHARDALTYRPLAISASTPDVHVSICAYAA